MRGSRNKQGGGRIVINEACGHWKVDSRTLLKEARMVDRGWYAWQATSDRTEMQITVLTFLTVPPTLRTQDLTGEITLVRRPVPLLAPKAISMEAVLISINSVTKSNCIYGCWHTDDYYLRTIAFQPNYRPAIVHIRIHRCSSSGRVSVACLTRNL
jgi:hypothetical protein